MSYFLAPSLVKLRDEVNQKWPKRDKASDGWIGDPSHAARKSDHNPDWGAPGDRRGVVRALDITRKGIRPFALLKRLKKDSRVYYIIFNGYIYSRTYGFKKQKYNGANAHTTHLHVSILDTDFAEKSVRPWLPTFVTVKTRGARVDKALVLLEQALAIAKGGRRRKLARAIREAESIAVKQTRKQV